MEVKLFIPGVKGFLTGNKQEMRTHIEQNKSGLVELVDASIPTCERKTVLHDCYTFLDVKTKDLKKMTAKMLPPTEYKYGTKSVPAGRCLGTIFTGINEITEHKLNILGTFPITFAQWKAYIKNTAPEELVRQIENLLTKFNLKNLIIK